MPQTRNSWFMLMAVTALVGAVWIGLTHLQPDAVNPTGRPPSPDIGHPAPDFILQTLDGSEVALSDFKGQPVIINFWATWCGPCRAEIPALESASVILDGQAVILGVDMLESPATVQGFVDEFGLTYPVVLDRAGEVGRLYRVRATPTTYFIDERGVITDIFTGPLNEPMLRAWVRDRLED